MEQLKFDIDGNVYHSCPYCSVYRNRYMLVVEFINNSILPMLLEQDGENGRLVVLGTKVLSVRKNLTITIKCMNSDSSISFVLESEDESVIGTIADNSAIDIGAFRFRYSQVLGWAKSHNIERPVGCVRTCKGSVILNHCRIVNFANYFVACFQNGFKFPIFLESNGVRVVQETVECSKFGTCVRVYECDEYQVRFSVAIYWKNGIRVFDDIVYTPKGVRYGSQFLSGGSIAKLMLLGG